MKIEDYNEYYIQGSDHYLIPKDIFNEMINWKEESQKQKEVIDKAIECSYIYENSLGKTRLVNEDIFDEVNNVLQKYKEMVGVSDENNT